MSRPVLNGLDLNNKRITALADPSSATDAATKQYVDNVINGLSWKSPVRAATVAAGTLATGFENGDVIDGVTLATGDRILIKDQAAGAENGIYTVNATGAPTRATDMDTSVEAVNNTTVLVMEGTVNADKSFTLTNNGTITLGTTALTWAQVGGGSGTTYTAGNGLTESPAGTFNVGAGNGIQVTADAINVDAGVVARKFSASCVATTNPQTFTHNLGTQDVIVQVRRDSDDVLVETDVTATDGNNVSVDFGGAPSASQYRVTVIG